jgi:hypothetical protein
MKHEILVGGVSNAFFNGVIAWLLLRGGASLSWQGPHSFVGDIVATAFILPLIVAFIVIPLQRSKLASGKLPVMRLDRDSKLQALVDSMPGRTSRSAPLFGLIGVCLFAPLGLLALLAGGVHEITPAAYAIFKGAWAGIMAAALVVPMVLLALRERTGSEQRLAVSPLRQQ